MKNYGRNSKDIQEKSCLYLIKLYLCKVEIFVHRR